MRKIFHYNPLCHLIYKILLIVSFVVLLNGCGSWKLSQLWSNQGSAKITSLNNSLDSSLNNPENNKPNEKLNPIPLSLPQIPTRIQELSTKSMSTISKTTTLKDQKILYKTEIVCNPKNEDIVEAVKNTTKLYKLAQKAPQNRVGLEFRVNNDEGAINKILKSYGYYSGKILPTIDYSVSPVLVKLNIELGPQYKIEDTVIRYKDYTPTHAPISLEKNGLPNGAPAITKDILASIDNFSQWLSNNGYPFAKINRTKYAVDKKTHTMIATIIVNQGTLVHMGNVIAPEDSSVNAEYLNRIKTWEYGAVWNNRRIDRYINKLAQKNIFSRINIKPYLDGAKESDTTQDKLSEQPIVYDALLEISDSTQRSYGGGINYETDIGSGVQAFWEHRNIFSSSESLRISTEISEDRQLADISYKIPDFISTNQNLMISTWINNHKTDAYEQKSAWAGINLERRLSRYWRVSMGTTLDSGEIKEADEKTSGYTMIGIPLNLMFSSTRDPLNRTSGIVSALQLIPYIGRYTKEFSIVRGKLDLNTYYPILSNDRVVLALKTTFGTLFNDESSMVPASIRFYAGGGGSVRGYKFQSVGPKNQQGNPTGGSSLLETSFEIRIKITETIGIVPFIDGGNVFEDAIPNLQNDAMQWGAGLGFRYYTAIGPMRLDIATPLNPRDGDAPFFMYISIGQSF